jgi:hypothetical protein
MSQAADYTFTMINVPSSRVTEAFGINSSSNIVGQYLGQNGWQWFLYNGTSYSTFAVNGAIESVAYGISGNNVVGYYVDNNNIEHGFLYNNSGYTTIDVPGAIDTELRGIDGNNIVGSYENSNGQWLAFEATPAATPLPAAAYLFGSGLLGLVGIRKKMHR